MELIERVPFTRLLGGVGNIGPVTRAFEREIRKTVLEDRVPFLTQAEIKRRFDLCVKIFKILVGDMHWGIERTLGHVGEYLRSELDGVPWEPSARASWMPNE